MSERGARSRHGWRRRAAALAALCGVAAACDAGSGGRAAPELIGSGTDGPSVGETPGAIVPDAPPAPSVGARGTQSVGVAQIAAFADSAAAWRLRDSLAAEGWHAVVRQVRGDRLPPWRVRVAPTTDREVLQLVAAGWRATGRTVQLVGDTATLRAPVVRVHRVNRGTHGMRAAVRWALSPDRDALVVVEDPVSIEDDPLPDGFLYAGERKGVVMQRDSVWDVAPDPAWERLAYGRAFLVRGEGRNAVSGPEGGWLAIAARTNMSVSEVRRGAFPASGMAPLFGFAQPMIESVSSAANVLSLTRQVTAPVPMVGGWRVRWSADGNTLAVGLPPMRGVADDASPSAWVAVDARSQLSRGEVPSYVRLATVQWAAGPTFDVESRVDTAPRRLPIDGGEVRSAGGWITVNGPISEGEPHVIGPGAALAATAGGRFVVALAPAAAPAETDPKVELVVYELLR